MNEIMTNAKSIDKHKRPVITAIILSSVEKIKIREEQN
jgi:hypothetical protein